MRMSRVGVVYDELAVFDCIEKKKKKKKKKKKNEAGEEREVRQ